MKIPAAKNAVIKRRTCSRVCWLGASRKFGPKQTSFVKLKTKKTSVHFTTSMDLCHLNHSELAEHLQNYQGRVVFRGDSVRDDTACQAVLTEQGASASQMTAATVLDTTSPTWTGWRKANDAASAYTQVKMQDASIAEASGDGILQIGAGSLRNRRPANGDMIDQPVVRLESNVYGHPLAGLFWELKLEDVWLQEHWENVKRWEYLFPSEITSCSCQSMRTTSRWWVVKEARLECGQHCERRRHSGSRLKHSLLFDTG